jgi:hypothetical protein
MSANNLSPERLDQWLRRVRRERRLILLGARVRGHLLAGPRLVGHVVSAQSRLAALVARRLYRRVMRHFCGMNASLLLRRRLEAESMYRAVSRYHLRRLRELSKFDFDVLCERLRQSPHSADTVRISLVGASRRLNNPNNTLNLFLDSLLEQTRDRSSVEVVLRIDQDDDLLYYYDLKERYGEHLRLVFSVGPQKKGYRGLHTLVASTLEHVSPTSKIVLGCTDDSIISRLDWDIDFLEALEEFPDEIFFINTLRDYAIPYDQPLWFFWQLLTGGPPAVLAGVSRTVLDILKAEAQKYSGWTAFGNSVMCDSFFETLQMYLWQLTGEKREAVLPETIRILPDVRLPAHKEGGLFRDSRVAQDAFRDFLSTETQSVIAAMARSIARQMAAKPANTDLPPPAFLVSGDDWLQRLRPREHKLATSG